MKQSTKEIISRMTVFTALSILSTIVSILLYISSIEGAHIFWAVIDNSDGSSWEVSLTDARFCSSDKVCSRSVFNVLPFIKAKENCEDVNKSTQALIATAAFLQFVFLLLSPLSEFTEDRVSFLIYKSSYMVSWIAGMVFPIAALSNWQNNCFSALDGAISDSDNIQHVEGFRLVLSGIVFAAVGIIGMIDLFYKKTDGKVNPSTTK